jgi:hypothetical protein
MQNQHTVLVGQALQYRDKLNAKRHIVPKELCDHWHNLMQEADKLVPKINPNTRKKQLKFTGSIEDLRSLLTALKKMNTSV